MNDDKRIEHPEWFFMWSNGIPYITMICGWTRRDVINEVGQQFSEPWKKTYRRGGRVVRCIVEIVR